METGVQGTERWRLELFGGLRLERGECVLTRLETRKAAALLAHLALFPHRAHPRESLAELLWPEEDPHATLPRLRQALAAIRRGLEEIGVPAEGALVTDRTAVRLNPQTLTTDVAEFEAALRAAGQSSDVTERAEWLSRAVELYRGELLAGYDEAWITAERQRFGEAWIEALNSLARARAEAGDMPAAIEAARRAVQADPLREESHRALMQLYAAAGRTPEALRQYRELERVLRDEFGASPSPETHDLLSQWQSPTPAPATPPRAAFPSAFPAPRHHRSEPARPLNSAAGEPQTTLNLKAPRGWRLPLRSRQYAALAAAAVVLGVLLAGLFLQPGRRDSAGLQLRSGPKGSAKPSPGRTAPLNVDAETLYEQGRDAWNDRSEEGFLLSQALFQQAIQKDPRHARAYSGLADTYSLLAYYGFIDPQEAESKAEAAVEQALRIDPDLVEAHTSRAWIKMAFDWDWTGAEAEFKRVTKHTPPYATAHQWYSLYLMIRGRTQDSLSEMKKARELEPLSRVITKGIGQRYYHVREYDQAIQEFRKALRGEPTSSLTRYWLGLAYEQKALGYQEAGRRADARRAFQMARNEFLKAQGYSLGRPAPAIVAALGHLHAVSGDPTGARKKLRELQGEKGRYASPVARAIISTGLGDKAQALTHLEEARRQRATELILLEIEPRFDPLREEERFIRLQRSIWPN